jgi:hypothetical protein
MPAKQPLCSMRELLRSNDAVLISFAESVLRQIGIVSVLADQHVSVVEGSIGAFPRRLLVREEDWPPARRSLLEAGLDQWLLSDGETST